MPQHDNLPQLNKWFRSCYAELLAYAEYDLDLFSGDVDAVMEQLAVALLRCKAKSKNAFLTWAKHFLNKLADRPRLIDTAKRLTLAQIAVLANCQTKSSKQEFAYEIHNDKLFVRVEDKAG